MERETILFFVNVGVMWIGFYVFYRFGKKQVSYSMPSHKWIPISEIPSELAIGSNLCEIIITDGTETKSAYGLTYNEKAQPIMSSYRRSIVTHWMPMPAPPEVLK